MKTSSLRRIVAFVLVVAVLATGLAMLPAKDYPAAMLRWIESIGPVGPAVLGGLYVVACVLFVPNSILVNRERPRCQATGCAQGARKTAGRGQVHSNRIDSDAPI